MITKIKIFRDPIYGYISIPNYLCDNFIDTAIFQRLRRIEQTSMRGLYPTAHHDRFAHSIGVYYLGNLAFQHIRRNSKDNYSEISPDEWDLFFRTFEVACLMHDCGHSPFSHTFEHYYLHNREDEIKEKLSSYFENEDSFSDDYDTASAAAHEKISALVLLLKFKEKIESYNADPLLAARMIMGCKYEMTESQSYRVRNKIINLLNGEGIDVDSLDYIQRDSWASGVSNVNIDYHRLFSSIKIKNDKNNIPQIVFSKHVLSALENISIGRNFLYKWIYSHHKVTYEQYLLCSITEDLNKNYDNTFCKSFFSIDTFLEPQSFNDYSFYLPTDDDLIFLLKQNFKLTAKINEYFSREHKYKALWKTYFEFNDSYFREVSPDNRMKIVAKLKNGALKSKYGDDLLCIPAKPKLKGIKPNVFFIDINDNLIDASQATSTPTQNLNYFLIYLSESLRNDKKEVLQNILSLQS